MKRVQDINNYPSTRSRKNVLVGPLEPSKRARFFISGTDVKNYMMNDTLVDWLKQNKKQVEDGDFLKFISERGNEFEKEIVDYFKESKLDIVSISDKITDESCRDTIYHMKLGTPIIHSAPFKNCKKNLKGIIDFLVRSDYLHNIVNENPIPEDVTTHRGAKLSGDYHYVVVDAKFSTLNLRADGIHLLNSGSYPYYKAQLYIYTNGIADIQGYKSRYAFILGRRWSFKSKGDSFSGSKCFDKLGTIDYEGVDKEYIEKTSNAITWLKDIRKNGKKWTVNPPSREELYPNMSHTIPYFWKQPFIEGDDPSAWCAEKNINN